ncbi:Subtilisin-like protease 8 [Smittium mucronatum]|uniref:Subtilisin-like protease 8 n=1 Tax=Smittium mucronatum TaxID=133383 RepID=A0A1R0GUU7_9FUNG|nr:Subtilisin-like protease 8 [Smittium mucronatum]
MFFKQFISITALSLLGSASAYFSPQVQNQVPLLSSTGVQTIPDSYIVVLKRDAKTTLESLSNHIMMLNNFISSNSLSTTNNEVKHIYDNGFFGYSGKFDSKLIENIRSSKDVEFVEMDQVVYASDTQDNAPWGLARISHREPLNFGTFNKYIYDPKAGSNITAYIVDTGVNINHVDFEGRATWGKTIPRNDLDIDGNGHGTHVAGTIGSKTYGVAKKAALVAVKVLGTNGSGSMSDVVAGVQFTVTDHKARVAAASKSGSPSPRSVANMSLGGGFSRALNTAVESAVSAGVHYIVAAGNDNRDACSYSPASAEAAITVGSSDFADTRSYFSNTGKCVDVFAPGRNILSTWIGSNTATNTISGTSMASPHVCGLAAYILSLSETDISPKDLKALIINTSTTDILKDIGTGSPNLLIFNSPPAN